MESFKTKLAESRATTTACFTQQHVTFVWQRQKTWDANLEMKEFSNIAELHKTKANVRPDHNLYALQECFPRHTEPQNDKEMITMSFLPLCNFLFFSFFCLKYVRF